MQDPDILKGRKKEHCAVFKYAATANTAHYEPELSAGCSGKLHIMPDILNFELFIIYLLHIYRALYQ